MPAAKISDPAAVLRGLMETGLKAADPRPRLASFLPAPPKGRTVVVGAGKAAAAMAQAVEKAWPKSAPLSGLVVTRFGCCLPLRGIECLEAPHPVPGPAGEQAAARILRLVQGLSSQDLVLVLISGGGSALMSLPAPGLAMEEKQRITKALLASGAAIGEINTVRKHLSAIKGGRLAAAAFPARVVTLAVSDVVGDDPAVIASGPTVGDPTSTEDARAVLSCYGIALPPVFSESVKPSDTRLALADYRLYLKPADMLDAVAGEAARRGLSVSNLGDRVEGEAREVARRHAELALVAKPGTLILSGGELTVTVKGSGRGGPNGEYLLAMAEALQGAANIHALAIDSDGIDGTGGNAGAMIEPGIVERARAKGVDAKSHLAANDSYGFFAMAGGLVKTGPQLSNLNDLRLILVL